MNASDPRDWHRLFNAALNDQLSAADKLDLAAVLKSSAEARQLWFLYHDNECSLAEIKHPRESIVRKKSLSWFQWRPLTAAAVGLVFGMIGTSVVFGYVADRAAVKSTPLPVFDPSLEGIKPLDTGLPHHVDEWGVRSAQIVPAEQGVQPLQGDRMLRLEPAPLGEQDKNLYARAYQVLDLRSLPSPARSETREVLVSASFSAAQSKMTVRHSIRVFALNEPPGAVTENFWTKAEEGEEVVSLTQRFVIEPGDTGWRPFSAKMPLPSGAQSLVIIFSATSRRDEPLPTPVSYLDDVQVTLLTSPSPQP